MESGYYSYLDIYGFTYSNYLNINILYLSNPGASLGWAVKYQKTWVFVSIILLFEEDQPSENTCVPSSEIAVENKIKGNPIPNIKIITHYKQITILNVIFVIMLMVRPALSSLVPSIHLIKIIKIFIILKRISGIKQMTVDSIFKCSMFKALMSATRQELG